MALRHENDPPSGTGPDADLPFADEIDDNLPFGEEVPDGLSETEAYIYGGGTIFATSSAIDEWKYDGSNKSLYIKFKGSEHTDYYGRIYRMDGVEFSTVMDFYRSDSPGRFFNWHLKGRYPNGAKLGSMPASKGRNIISRID